jgi:inosine-uridine nucleoside N-ribohydrolase
MARHQRVHIAGISVVNGNTDARTAARCTRALVAAAGMRVPVTDMDAAATAIAELPSGISLLSLGPLTNIAAALRLNPRCCNDRDLRMVAAVRHAWRHPILVLSDLNQRTDPSAAAFTRSAGWRELRILPLDVIRRLRIDRAALEQLRAAGPLGAYLSQHCERWLARAAWRYPWLRSFPAWDLVAALDALALLHGVQFDTRHRMLTDFDAAHALTTFYDLIGGSRTHLTDLLASAAATLAPSLRGVSHVGFTFHSRAGHHLVEHVDSAEHGSLCGTTRCGTGLGWQVGGMPDGTSLRVQRRYRYQAPDCRAADQG